MRSELERARSQVKVLILTGLGLNCEAETAQAFRMCGTQPDLVHLSDMVDGHAPRKLPEYDIVSMIGGFSFGDHLAAGVVYANRLRARLLDPLETFIRKGGLMIGICNGFQTMVKLGVLPGVDGDYQTQRATLAANDRLGYRDAWVTLRAEETSPCVWTRGIGKIDLPARHGEGKFLVESEALLARLERDGLVAVRYVDARGEPTEQWPANPNGSPRGIAGVCDPTGRIFGLMPHPDAYLYGFHHPQWQKQKLCGTLREEGEGIRIFRNGVEYAANAGA
jgi:phosphoribosylformylglycinamidine synthase subunit PurQ / glutaminase